MTLVTVFSDKRKSITLKINTDGSIKVLAPTGTKMETIRKLVEKHMGWIDKNRDKVMLKAKRFEEADVEKLRREAYEFIPRRVNYFADKMGVQPKSIKITSAKTRFGSCSSKDGLCFSLYLMMYPMGAVDYVVVHELAHIIEKNHSKRFYAVVEKYMPDYKERLKYFKM